jgi:hypothetical protein
MRERFCVKCGTPHRVFFHASQYGNLWFIQFLEEDLGTSFCGNLTYSTLDEVRDLLRRLRVSVDQGEDFESGTRSWNIGACFVTLTPRQYAALKTKFSRKAGSFVSQLVITGQGAHRAIQMDLCLWQVAEKPAFRRNEAAQLPISRLAGISALDLWIVRLNHREEPLAGQKGRLWEFCGKHHATTWVIVSKTSK